MAVTSTLLDYDRDVLQAMAPKLHALWRPLRFLADLERVWRELSDAQRAEIASSRPYRDQFHRRLAEGHVLELRRLVSKLQAPEHRELRDSLKLFLDRWEFHEPDQVRVLSALVRRAVE